MKPLGEDNGKVDYTKNERWKLSEFLVEMRENKHDLNLNNDKNLTNNKNSNYVKRNNLILSYYNKNDPYIKMFEKMAKTNNIKNNIIIENGNSEINNTKYYNPILENLNNNTFTSFNKKYFDDKNNIKEKFEIKDEKEENNKNIELNKYKNNNNTRPKTCYKSVGPTNHEKIIKRPMTSKINEYNIFYTNFNEGQDKKRRNSFTENYLEQNSNLEYISSNCFPLKTISNVGNVSYDKINQMLQERKFKNDYFLTSIGKIRNNLNNKNKYKEEKIIIDKNNNCKNNASPENNKWNENINNTKFNKKNKINFYNFDNIRNNLVKYRKKGDNFYTMKYFKNMGGKFYSSSNNVNVKNKRNNKRKLLNNFYSESKYSRDEQEKEIDFIDEAVSSQTNSSYQKK